MKPTLVSSNFGVQSSSGGPTDGGGGSNLELRITKLELGIESLNTKVDLFRDESTRRFDGIDRRLDKLPTEWGMAKVIFYVMAALMAGAIFLPRVLAGL